MVEKTIVIKALTADAKKNIKDVGAEVKATNKATTDLSASTGALDKATGGMATKFKSTIGSLKGVTAGFKTMRGAIISTGIGALVIGITSLIAAFKSSEEGQNKFNKLMGVIGVVTNNIIDIFADLGEKLISVFENPKQAIQDFVKLLRENIINRFEGLLELIPNLGKAIQQLFKGNFAEAGTIAANAVGKVTLGVEDIVDKTKNAIKSTKDFAKTFVEESKKEIEAAKRIADQRAEADKAERKLITDRAEANRKIAELREKAADKENVSVEERLVALREAGRINDEIAQQEIEAARLRFEAKKAENELSKSTKEDLDEQARLESRLIELETNRLNTQKRLTAEITTALREEEAERKRIESERLASEKQTEKEKTEFIKAQRDALATDLDSKAALEIEKQKEKYDALIEQAKKYNLDTTELEKARAVAIESVEFDLAEKKKLIKDQELKAEEALAKQKQQIVTQALSSLIAIVGANSKFGKGIAVVQAIRDTYAAANTALKSAPPPFNFVSAAATVAAGLANVKAITSTQDPQAPSFAGSRSMGQSVSVALPTPPQINTIGTSGVNQLAQTISGQADKPIKAYVVAGEVTSAQSLERNAVKEASI